jgi:hypothetical protein
LRVTTGVKIAIGCGVALILGIIVVAIGIGGAAYWAKGKVEEVTGNESKIEELHAKANATPFEAPADGIVREDRFLKFLDIRKRVFAVYEKHKGTLEAMNKKKQGDWGDVTTGFSVINEVRTAQAQALADVGMSEDEYRFMVEQVYKTAWAAGVADSTGGKSVSDATADSYKQAADAMEKMRAENKARGVAGSEESEEADASAQKSIDDLRKASEDARANAKDTDVPPQNIALFKKHEAEIKKYAMGGLEWIGL